MSESVPAPAGEAPNERLAELRKKYGGTRPYDAGMWWAEAATDVNWLLDQIGASGAPGRDAPPGRIELLAMAMFERYTAHRWTDAPNENRAEWRHLAQMAADALGGLPAAPPEEHDTCVPAEWLAERNVENNALRARNGALVEALTPFALITFDATSPIGYHASFTESDVRRARTALGEGRPE